MEACGFRDAIKEIEALDAQILGASLDTLEDQKAFAEKFDVPYPMLCDTDKSLASSYGVLGAGGGVNRVSFLIDKQGVVRKVWKKVKPAVHAAEVIESLRSL